MMKTQNPDNSPVRLNNSLLSPIRHAAGRAMPATILAALLVSCVPSVWAQVQRPQISVTGYVIDAELDPVRHHISATTKVNVTALETVDTVAFQLHNSLKVNKISDASNTVISGDRTADSSIRLALPRPLAKGQTASYTFQYEGILSGSEDGPVEGLKLTAIGDPITYLLYAGRWFPMVGYLTDRFTAEMHIRIPSGYRVIGSGLVAVKPGANGMQQFDFNWTKSGFPGTIVAGKFEESIAPGANNVHLYVTKAHQPSVTEYGTTAGKEHDFFTSTFGPPDTPRLNVVELPDDTVPAYWGPEIAAIAGSHIADKSGFRLLANIISRQWWGNRVSPAALNDAWITNGMARYSELLYLEDVSGKTAVVTAIQDVSAGALAYDTIPLTASGRLNPFSPEFQSMTQEKGALVFHMLRWEVGDESFRKILVGILTQFADKPVRTTDVAKVAEAQSQQQLTPFFAQWLDGTGAPQFNDKYAVYRLGNNKGFRTIGEIGQDLDLFSMPIELRVDTDGKTEIKRIDVSGTDSQYVIDTFGRPRKISIDPDNWVLKNTADMQVRVAILRGQQMVAQGDATGALGEFQKALTANPNSSLASYRIGEVFFAQRNYQSSANSYRDALRGDDDPKWTEVWSHIQLGKIFDVTGQRDRAVNEYRQAVQTNDNTQGALNEARKYLQQPYKRDDALE